VFTPFASIIIVAASKRSFCRSLGLTTEGIFRVPGANDRIQDFKQQYNTLRSPQFALGDVHSVAGILKLYFRELADPLIPASRRADFMALDGNTSALV
jgi:hypothetical protein